MRDGALSPWRSCSTRALPLATSCSMTGCTMVSACRSWTPCTYDWQCTKRLPSRLAPLTRESLVRGAMSATALVVPIRVSVCKQSGRTNDPAKHPADFSQANLQTPFNFRPGTTFPPLHLRRVSPLKAIQVALVVSQTFLRWWKNRSASRRGTTCSFSTIRRPTTSTT